MVKYDGLTKAEVLKALYDASRPLGLGFLQFIPGDISLEEAEKLVKKTDNFDYLNGRVIKVTLGDDGFEEWLYDRDMGEGAAQKAVDEYRAKKEVTINP